MMKEGEISKGLKVTVSTASLYIILFVLVMYSGSTFLSEFVMPLICILVLLLFGMAKVQGIQRKAFYNRKNFAMKIIMVAIEAFLLYQLSFSYNPSTTAVFAERFAVYGLLFLFVPTVELNVRVIKAIRWYSFPVAISIILSTLISGSKSGGLVGSYQFSGMMMSISFGVMLINYYFDKDKKDMIGMVLTLVALFTSGKRFFTLMGIMAYILVAKLNNDPGKRKKFITLTSLMAVTVLAAYFLVPSARLVFERFQSYAGDTTYNGRVFYWEAAGQIFLSHKFTGIGMGCFSQYFDMFFHRLGNLEAYDAHNVYIQMAAELGIIGEGLVLALFIFCLVKTFILFKSEIIKSDHDSMYVLVYSLFIQVWFILYCMTGNPLYGAGQCFFYFAAVSMMLSVNRRIEYESRF